MISVGDASVMLFTTDLMVLLWHLVLTKVPLVTPGCRIASAIYHYASAIWCYLLIAHATEVVPDVPDIARICHLPLLVARATELR